jgi:hypothetical protein
MVSEALGAEELCRQKVTKVTQSTGPNLCFISCNLQALYVNGLKVDHHATVAPWVMLHNPPTHLKSKEDVLLLWPFHLLFLFILFCFCFVVSCDGL